MTGKNKNTDPLPAFIPDETPETLADLHEALKDNGRRFQFRTECAWEIVRKMAPVLDAAAAFPGEELSGEYRAALEDAAMWIGAGGVVPGLRTELDRYDAAQDFERPTIQADILRRIKGYTDTLDVRPVTAFKGEPAPAPVLWKQPETGKENDPLHGAVLRAGDIAILSGSGGVGKSTLALQLAVASAGAARAAEPCRSVAGLTVRGGPVLYASYEDSGADQYRRAKRLDTANAEPPDGLHVACMFGRPLYGPPPGSEGHAVNAEPGPRAAWGPFWKAAARIGAGLVVIDPAQAAFCSPGFSAQWTRLFLDAVRIEAERIGAGVLVIAHSTKAARTGLQANDPGNVSGSAAWHDAARGVLVFQAPQEATDKAPAQPYSLACVKANHGPSGWSVPLDNDGRGGPFELVDEAAMQARYGGEAGSTLKTENDNGETKKERPW